jgi:predicted ATPase
MLKKLRVKNFKCFREEKEFDFGRITLLLGANSSGKSSVMYAVLGAIQSGEFPFQFSPNGKYVNMGDYRDMVWGHEVEREIEIGLEFAGYFPYRIDASFHFDYRDLPRLQELDLSLPNTKLVLKADELGYYVHSFPVEYPNNLEMVHAEGSEIRKKWIQYLILVENTDEREIKDYEFQIESLDNLSDEFTYLEKYDGEFRNSPQSWWLGFFLKDFGAVPYSMINFISSFRLHPERTYYESTKSDLRVEKFGEGYLDQIMLWDAKYPDKVKELLHWMKEMDLITDMKANRMGGGRYEVQVKTKEKGVFAALGDVGFGLSQFLPILVADIQLPEDSTLFIQQPESQLHPSVQANFGDYLTKRVNETQKNYVVETHSEYLLNRIRLNIVKGILKPEDLQVYFLESEEDDTAVHKIVFTTDGKIQGAPSNFFKTYFIDVMDIAIHAIPE